MKQVLFACVLMLSGIISAQHKLEFKVVGAEDSTLNLIRYYGEKLYYADTAVADKTGKVSFDGSWAKKPGMYAVMGPGKKWFEVILNNEDVYIETNLNNFIGKMDVKKSKENQLFYEYIKWIGDKRRNAEALVNQKKNEADEKKKEAIDERLKGIDKAVVDYQKNFVKKHEGTLVSEIVNMSMEIQVPEPPKDDKGVVTDSSFQRNYYITHYWDNFNLKNDAITRMSGFHKRLEKLYEDILLKHPDSLIEYTNRLMKKIDEGSEVYKYTVVHITSKFQSSKIMCLDAVFVDMVLNHYKTGKAFWMSEEKNKEIVERAEAMAPNVCGQTPHNIALRNVKQEWPRLFSLKNDYIILMFWSPDCGHCKKEMPKLVEAYNGWKKDGIDVEVYAVSSINGKEWTDFIEKEKMNWINTAVPKEVYEDQNFVNRVVQSGKSDLPSLNYHDTFDVYKTPTIYLIDKDRVIVGKNLETSGLDDILRKLSKTPKGDFDDSSLGD